MKISPDLSALGKTKWYEICPQVCSVQAVLLFFCFSCFSTRVALAGKIAGNAEEQASDSGGGCDGSAGRTSRGKEAAGAEIGSIGLIAFAVAV